MTDEELRDIGGAMVRAFIELHAAEQEDFWPAYAERCDAAKEILKQAIRTQLVLSAQADEALRRLADADADLGLKYE